MAADLASHIVQVRVNICKSCTPHSNIVMKVKLLPTFSKNPILCNSGSGCGQSAFPGLTMRVGYRGSANERVDVQSKII